MCKQHLKVCFVAISVELIKCVLFYLFIYFLTIALVLPLLALHAPEQLINEFVLEVGVAIREVFWGERLGSHVNEILDLSGDKDSSNTFLFLSFFSPLAIVSPFFRSHFFPSPFRPSSFVLSFLSHSACPLSLDERNRHKKGKLGQRQ